MKNNKNTKRKRQKQNSKTKKHINGGGIGSSRIAVLNNDANNSNDSTVIYENNEEYIIDKKDKKDIINSINEVLKFIIKNYNKIFKNSYKLLKGADELLKTNVKYRYFINKYKEITKKYKQFTEQYKEFSKEKQYSYIIREITITNTNISIIPVNRTTNINFNSIKKQLLEEALNKKFDEDFTNESMIDTLEFSINENNITILKKLEELEKLKESKKFEQLSNESCSICFIPFCQINNDTECNNNEKKNKENYMDNGRCISCVNEHHFHINCIGQWIDTKINDDVEEIEIDIDDKYYDKYYSYAYNDNGIYSPLPSCPTCKGYILLEKE